MVLPRTFTEKHVRRSHKFDEVLFSWTLGNIDMNYGEDNTWSIDENLSTQLNPETLEIMPTYFHTHVELVQA